MSCIDSIADRVAPELRMQADLRELHRLLAKYPERGYTLMNPLGEITFSPAQDKPKNDKDPVLELLISIEERLESIEEQQEEMLEKLHDLESNTRLFSA